MTILPSTWALLLDVALFLAELLITARRHSCAGFCVLLIASFSFSSNTEVSICPTLWCLLFSPFWFPPHDTSYRCTFRFQPASGLAYYTVQEQVAAIVRASRTASEFRRRTLHPFDAKHHFALLIAKSLLYSERCSGARHRVTSSQRVLSTTEFSTASALSAFP